MPDIVTKSDEQKSAEADVESFHDELGPFVVAAETTRMAMVFTDACEPDNPIIFVNDAFLHLTGYAREEVLGQDFNFLLVHAADAQAVEIIRTEFESHSDSGSEIRYHRKDGSEFWAAVFISPVRDSGGAIVQHFASFVDLTLHKEELVHSRMLIDELNHRVKNTLATVQSIVWQAARANSAPQAMRQAVETRLFALSRSHDLLNRKSWQSAGLLDIVQDALEPFVVTGGRSSRIVIVGDNVLFPARMILALGIAFNELATNAVKYGAFSNETGSIHISWTVDPTPSASRLTLLWQEVGGPTVTPASRKGFGSMVIERTLGHELGGEVHLDYPPEGVVCTMNIPIPGQTDE
ncbi:MAG: PAS domain-containing protein [Rhizobiaceae bacterium]|nr:PAS domain-containing protein [Rhizobiaceae bacterium]